MALCLGGGVFGLSLGSHLTQSGFYDGDSESAQASRLGDQVYGRDTSGHIVAIYTAPDGKTVDDPAFRRRSSPISLRSKGPQPDPAVGRLFQSPGLLRNMADASEACVHVDSAQGQ